MYLDEQVFSISVSSDKGHYFCYINLKNLTGKLLSSTYYFIAVFINPLNDQAKLVIIEMRELIPCDFFNLL